MPLAKIKTEEERARLDRIFAEVEAADRGDVLEPVDTRTQTEINLLRNFANGVSQRYEKAERSAREQDNHHYYKIFAECVKEMLEKL